MRSQNILVSKNTEVSAFYIFNTWFFYLEVSICLKHLLLEYPTSLTFQLASFSEQERIKVRPSLTEDEDTDSLWWDSCDRAYEQNKPPPPCFGVSKTFLCISSILLWLVLGRLIAEADEWQTVWNKSIMLQKAMAQTKEAPAVAYSETSPTPTLRWKMMACLFV